MGIAAMVVDAVFDVPTVRICHVKTKSPSILINVEITPPVCVIPHAAEVQIHLDHFLAHKKHQHKSYEFVRACCQRNFTALLRPIYKTCWNGAVGHIDEQAEQDVSPVALRCNYWRLPEWWCLGSR